MTASVAPVPVVGNAEAGVSASYRRCTRCGCDRPAELRQTVSSGGQVQVGWVCTVCDSPIPDKRGRQYIPHDELRREGIEPGDLPIFRNYANTTRCQRCGARGAQVHHWAPRAMFDDADAWPQDLLCQTCHDEWHNRVTPQLRRGNGRAA